MTRHQRPTPLLRSSFAVLALLYALSALAPGRVSGEASQPRAIDHRLEGDFLQFWKRHDGARTLGQPVSAPIWLDGRLVQLFARGRLERRQDEPASVAVATLPESWRQHAPRDLLAYAAAPQRATLAAIGDSEPLTPITVTLTVPGYTGSAELRIFDGEARPAGIWPAQIQNGAGSVLVEGRGALGPHQALVLIDKRIAGASSRLFTLVATTGVATGQPSIDDLYPRLRGFMDQDVVEYALDGYRVRGYRSPDNDLLWLRDHTYQGRGFRYFERDLTSALDAFRRAQRPDGSFPDYLSRPRRFVQAERREVEADLEYLFVQGVYEAWQATGDDDWLRANLAAMRRGIRYIMSDPLRWDAERRLVKRPFTIDSWDFEFGPSTVDPTNGALAPRHWIDSQTIWGIFHGDNTGLAASLRLMANIEQHFGNGQEAALLRSEARGIMARLNALSWNGHFFTHQIHLTPFSVPGVDEARQLSLSNAIALNRGVLRSGQARAIVDEYYQRFLNRGAAFAEWYSIDPPFPAGSFGMADGKGEQPGEYLNGGLMPLVGGELARGAFRVGAERYGFDILSRYSFLSGATGASYLWYYPAGNPGKSGPETLPTDGWGASAMIAALLEGAAGVEDLDARYQVVQLSPRWPAADVDDARVVARYAASDGYVAYHWHREDDRLTLDFTGSGERVTMRLLLPEAVDHVAQVMLDGNALPIKIEQVFGSRYAIVQADQGSGRVEVAW
ncbi:MAG TPA: hypothetical protein VFU22_04650 [Roseiflexaceae bacterium]|nr:hypothetical protein [Roseiflexaceae bacterium]